MDCNQCPVYLMLLREIKDGKPVKHCANGEKPDSCEHKTMNTCYYCGHTGTDVNHVAKVHVGGMGEVEYPCCDDIEACIKRPGVK